MDNSFKINSDLTIDIREWL